MPTTQLRPQASQYVNMDQQHFFLHRPPIKVTHHSCTGSYLPPPNEGGYVFASVCLSGCLLTALVGFSRNLHQELLITQRLSD